VHAPHAEAALKSGAYRAALHAAALARRPGHWRFHLAGIAREFHRHPSSLARLLAVSGVFRRL
jgi:hypothetical protein